MSLTDDLIKNGYLKTPAIIQAFKKIKRQDFLLPSDTDLAEINTPISIGYGQTNSQPLTVAFMMELLQPKPGEKILDIGSGSGWTCALLAQIVGAHGKVYSLERIKELKDFAEENINKYNFIKSGTVQLFCSDGYEGLTEYAPFNKIMVAAAAEKIPEKLLVQLKIGGVLVIPIGQQFATQEIVRVEKINEKSYNEKRYPGFAFVPLIKN